MDSTIHPADLDECVRPLDEDGQRELRRYWEQVTDELCPMPKRAPRAVPLPTDGRSERRQVRREVAQIAEVGRTRVRSLPAGLCGGMPSQGKTAATRAITAGVALVPDGP